MNIGTILRYVKQFCVEEPLNLVVLKIGIFLGILNTVGLNGILYNTINVGLELAPVITG
ncbi:hypothetical protein C7972_11259 [Arenibacter sp. ARW7G5Y1]|nr:hypothetical protein C7972_11259 [Arenibacter sp. ARW7G5Y1]